MIALRAEKRATKLSLRKLSMAKDIHIGTVAKVIGKPTLNT
jgi:hypothetical protein